MDVGGTELKDAKKALKTAEANVKKATAAIGKAEVDIKALEKKAIASEEACAQATKDHEAVVNTMQATIEELKKLEGLASECIESFNEVQAAEQGKKEEVSAAAAALAAAQKRCKMLRGEFEKYKQNYDVLADKLGKVQHEITAWDAKIQALKEEAESQYAFMQNIMEDKNKSDSSSTEEVNLLVNGQEINLPIIKSGQTSLEKEIIFLFGGYNKPKDLINYYSINEKVNLKIKNTNFEETFDVSSIKSVLESAVIQCYVKSLYESL